MVSTMFRVLALLALALPIYTSPLLARDILMKRDIAADVCGSPGSTRVADANRNAATWNLYKMDDWYGKLIRPYVVMDWKLGGQDPRNIQDIALYNAGKEGVGQCDEILEPNCGASGLDINLCNQTPEAHFLYIALTNWANFLSKLHLAWLDTVASLTPLTGTLRDQFFNTPEDLTQLLVPVGIISGVAGAISGFIGPVAIVAGAGAVINAIITQAALTQLDPTEQWSQVQAAIGSAFTQVTKALEEMFDKTLKSLPPQDTGTTYDVDPEQTPMLFKGGAFAAPVRVGVFGQGLYGALAASGINALWSSDGVFLMKISDKTYGKGDGEACKAFPTQTICKDGVAYIWLRWVVTGGAGMENVFYESHLDDRKWDVKGAYGDTAKLGEYGLDLPSITDSVIKTYNEHGFPFTDQNGATIDQINKDPKNLQTKDLMFFSLPICDMDKILDGKVLKGPPDQSGDNPIVRYGGCTCEQDPNWPADKSVYAPDIAGYVAETCRDQGWGDP